MGFGLEFGVVFSAISDFFFFSVRGVLFFKRCIYLHVFDKFFQYYKVTGIMCKGIKRAKANQSVSSLNYKLYYYPQDCEDKDMRVQILGETWALRTVKRIKWLPFLSFFSLSFPPFPLTLSFSPILPPSPLSLYPSLLKHF